MDKVKRVPRTLLSRLARYAGVGLLVLLMVVLFLPAAVGELQDWQGVSPDSAPFVDGYQAERVRTVVVQPIVTRPRVFLHAHNEVIAVMQPVLVVHKHIVAVIVAQPVMNIQSPIVQIRVQEDAEYLRESIYSTNSDPDSSQYASIRNERHQ